MNKGDTVLFMSDGLPEMFNTHGEMLGEERAKTLFKEAAGNPPQNILNHMVKAGEDWAKGQELKDDITFVVVKMK